MVGHGWLNTEIGGGCGRSHRAQAPWECRTAGKALTCVDPCSILEIGQKKKQIPLLSSSFSASGVHRVTK